jgi:glycine cleavage system aminomethyltransferase T
VNRSRGSVIYTQFLDRQGGTVGDLVVTRLGQQHFRIVCGSALVDSDLGWIQSHITAEEPSVAIRDVTEAFAVIGLFGPLAGEVLAEVTENDISHDGMGYMTAGAIEINGIDVLAQRISLCRRNGMGVVYTDR